MLSKLRSHLTYANVVATIALFLVLGGGTAVALSGSNTVFTDDIVNNQVYSADVRDDTLASGGLGAVDLRPGSVGGSEVANGSLTGADIIESSLGQVPDAAKLGGRDASEYARGQANGFVLNAPFQSGQQTSSTRTLFEIPELGTFTARCFNNQGFVNADVLWSNTTSAGVAVWEDGEAVGVVSPGGSRDEDVLDQSRWLLSSNTTPTRGALVEVGVTTGPGGGDCTFAAYASAAGLSE